MLFDISKKTHHRSLTKLAMPNSLPCHRHDVGAFYISTQMKNGNRNDTNANPQKKSAAIIYKTFSIRETSTMRQ